MANWDAVGQRAGVIFDRIASVLPWVKPRLSKSESTSNVFSKSEFKGDVITRKRR